MHTPSPYKGSDPYIFISYSHRDSDAVLKVISQMQQDGYRVWYDQGIDPGTEWDQYIAEKVVECGYMIAFISENYIASSNCKDELNFARDLEKDRLLVYLEEVTLPAGMAMRMNRLQSIYKYRYTSENQFYDTLYSANNISAFTEPQDPADAQKAPDVPVEKQAEQTPPPQPALQQPTIPQQIPRQPTPQQPIPRQPQPERQQPYGAAAGVYRTPGNPIVQAPAAQQQNMAGRAPDAQTPDPRLNTAPTTTPAKKESRNPWKKLYLYEKLLIIIIPLIYLGVFMNSSNDPSYHLDWVVSALPIVSFAVSFIKREKVLRTSMVIGIVLMVILGFHILFISYDLYERVTLLNRAYDEWRSHLMVEDTIFIVTSVPLLLRMLADRIREAKNKKH